MLSITMSRDTERPVTAVLGPTNTGKTHLAVERLCGHSSGMIGSRSGCWRARSMIAW